MNSEISAILLDAGGVLIFPEPDLLLPPLRAAGLSPDVAALERAHYHAMAIQDVATSEPAAGTWWREYLIGYLSACGVVDGRCADLAAEVAEATRGRAWTHVGTGSLAGLRALAALGLPMGVVSNSDGTVQAELRRLGVCAVPDGGQAAPIQAAPIQAAPIQAAPIQAAPIQAAPIQTAGVPVGVVVDSAVAGVAKPDPAIFRIALDALGVPPSASVLHVGDSVRYDVAGAHAAGLQPVHLDPHGFCPAPDGHEHVTSLAMLAERLS